MDRTALSGSHHEEADMQLADSGLRGNPSPQKARGQVHAKEVCPTNVRTGWYFLMREERRFFDRGWELKCPVAGLYNKNLAVLKLNSSGECFVDW